MPDTIKDRLETIFRQSFEIERFSDDLSIENVAGWDSMAHVGLILALQKEFKVTISPADAINLTSVKEIMIFMSSHGT